ARSPPEDYQYIAGAGYYKFEDQWETFENAQLICEKSGAHLAIINSQDEAYALVNVKITGKLLRNKSLHLYDFFKHI
ncbi:hypothetical protein J437_LFUL015906, partial [Ladona fulva]